MDELRRAGAHDSAFLATCCVGYEALEAYFTGAADGMAKDPDWAAGITGIPAPRIRELARASVGTRSYPTCSFAVQRAQHGEQPYWMAIALAAMLGRDRAAGRRLRFRPRVHERGRQSAASPRRDRRCRWGAIRRTFRFRWRA